MASFRITCVGCSKKFTAKASNAKWCTPTCKKRAERAKRAAAIEAAADDRSELELQITADLDAAGKLETFEGRLAVELAHRLHRAGPAGFTGMSRELRVVMASALGVEPATAPATNRPVEEGASAPSAPAEQSGPDPMDEIRRRRDEKRAAAAAAREAAGDGGADVVGVP